MSIRSTVDVDRFNNPRIMKRTKLDSYHQRPQQSSPICHFLNLPEEMITNILSYVGTNVGEENPSDGENVVFKKNLPNSTKDKFHLSLVCPTFNYLIKKPTCWEKNNVLTIYPKGITCMAGKLRINGILFTVDKVVEALQKFLEVTSIKQIVVVDVIQWRINDDTTNLREEMLQCFQRNEQRLKVTVDKITMHGFLNNNNMKDLVLWLCNSFPNLRSVNLTMPVNDPTTTEIFELNFEDTEIVNCALEKVEISRLQNCQHLLNILDGKRIQQLIIKIKWYMQNGTESLIAIINKIADGTLQKLVIAPFAAHSGIIHLHINQLLVSIRPGILSNLHHLELNYISLLDIANLPTILTLLPPSLVLLKLVLYNFILGNKIEVFRFLTHIITAFFERTAIQKGEFNFNKITRIDENGFQKYRNLAHKQWQGISIEQTMLEANGLSYKFEKYGRYLDMHIR